MTVKACNSKDHHCPTGSGPPAPKNAHDLHKEGDKVADAKCGNAKTADSLRDLSSGDPKLIADTLYCVDKMGTLSSPYARDALRQASAKFGGVAAFTKKMGATIKPDPTHAQYLHAVQMALKLGISDPFKLSAPALIEVVKNRTSTAPDKRPVALVLQAKSDWDQAFDVNLYDDLISHGYRVMFYEIQNVDQIASSVKQAASGKWSKTPPKIALTIIAGHGTPSTIEFCDSSCGTEVLLDSDYGLFKNKKMGQYFVKDSPIILVSCTTGEIDPNKTNGIANFIGRVFSTGGAVSVWAPLIEAKGKGELSFKDNSFTGFKFAVGGRVTRWNEGQFIDQNKLDIYHLHNTDD